MISPELLRRFPFFGFLSDTELKAVAMIASEMSYSKDEIILEHDKPAKDFHLVIEGSVSLFYQVKTEHNPNYQQEYYVSDINPGEIFGISALIEPFIYTGTVRANEQTKTIRINASSLRALCEVDTKLAYGMMKQTAKAAMERLHATRVLLISARI